MPVLASNSSSPQLPLVPGHTLEIGFRGAKNLTNTESLNPYRVAPPKASRLQS